MAAALRNPGQARDHLISILFPDYSRRLLAEVPLPVNFLAWKEESGSPD